MNEFVAKFTNLLWHVPSIKEEKSKVHQFVNFLPVPYKENIYFDNPITMDEMVRKDRLVIDSSRAKERDQNLGMLTIKTNRQWG